MTAPAHADRPSAPAVAGAVLCGGASRRMGRDKALIRIDGIPLAQRVATTLAAAGCTEVVLVGGDEQALAGLGLPWIPDRWPGAGPVGGVLTAISATTGSGTVVAACDLISLTADAVTAVIGGAAPDIDVVVADSGRVEPLLAWWSTGAAPTLESRFSGGERALHAVIADLRTSTVRVDPAAMLNANRPADLATVTALGRLDDPV